MRKLIIGLILFIVTASLILMFYINQKTPNRNQSINIKGLSAEVEVIYDDYGVPHIYAQNDDKRVYN